MADQPDGFYWCRENEGESPWFTVQRKDGNWLRASWPFPGPDLPPNYELGPRIPEPGDHHCDTGHE